MKLITEYTDNNIRYSITEDRNNPLSEKQFFIEGVFLQADVKNHNGRVYPKKMLQESLDQYINEQVAQDRAVGELTHSDTPIVNFNRVSHKITSLEWDGNDVIGTAKVLNTPCGKILKELIKENVRIGVSSRGVGNLTNQQGDSVVSDFSLRAVDVVQNPSAPNAFVQGILEEIQEWESTTAINEENNLIDAAFNQRMKTAWQLKDFNDWIMKLE